MRRFVKVVGGVGLGGSEGAEKSDLNLLASLDVCCPSLRSFALSQCPGLRSVVIEHRSPPPPAHGTAGDGADATHDAMATALRDVQVQYCQGLETLVFQDASFGEGSIAAGLAWPLRTPDVERLEGLSLHEESKTSTPAEDAIAAAPMTTAIKTTPPPCTLHRALLAVLKVHHCPALQHAEVEEGWTLRRQATLWMAKLTFAISKKKARKSKRNSQKKGKGKK